MEFTQMKRNWNLTDYLKLPWRLFISRYCSLHAVGWMNARVYFVQCIRRKNKAVHILIYCNGLMLCLDDNECKGLPKDSPCWPNGRCVNQDGGYYCECNEGWTGRKCQSGETWHYIYIVKKYCPIFSKTIRYNLQRN